MDSALTSTDQPQAVKPSILLIHGMWGTAHVWAKLRPLFESAGYTVISPNLRHHQLGIQHDPNLLGRTSLNTYLSDLSELVVAMNEPPVVIGHSMGGLLAQMLAAQNLTRAIGLLAPAPPSGPILKNPAIFHAFLKTMDYWGFWRKGFCLKEEDARKLLYSHLPPDEADLEFQKMVPDSGRAATEVAFWYFDPNSTTEIPPETVNCPVAMVAGTEDHLFSIEIARKIARRYPNIRYWEKPGAGHWLVGESGVEQIAEFFLKWLDEILIPQTAKPNGSH